MYLISGGSGFIGSHFHNAIESTKIVNLDLVEPFFKTSAAFQKGDIRKSEDFAGVLAKYPVKTIIALAAKHHDFGIGHDEYFDTNEEGTQVMCDAASKAGIDRIIFYSSVAVYGLRQDTSTEQTEPAPDSPYGASKLAGEKVLRQWAAASPQRSVLIIRPTIVFGANNRANMYNLIKQIDSGLYFHIGNGANIKSIAYVENLVKATLYLHEKMKPGVEIYNYADEPQLSSKRIAEIIAEALGKRIKLSVPLKLATLIGAPFDWAIALTGKNLPVSSARIKKLATQTHHSAVKLFNEGFIPHFTTIDGLKKMVAWYKTNR